MASSHQSLQRAIAILKVFSEAEPTFSVAEISRRLDIHKSTVSRILATLLEDGMVWHNPRTNRYSLGMTLVEMAGVALGQIDLRGVAMPHIDVLAGETCETVSLFVRRGDEALTIAHVASSQPIRHIAWIGRRVPLQSTAAGRLLVAIGERTVQDDPSRLSDVTRRILEQGYEVERDEFEIGTAVIATPIHAPATQTIAALSVSGPSDRISEESLVPLMLRAARAIEMDLGVHTPASAS